MARILTPRDYGLVGMITIFIAVSQSLIDSGFSQALIRKKDRSNKDNSTAFWFNIGVGIILYFILFFCAPLIARFYNEPLLVKLTRFISLSIIINSFIMVQRALLTANLDFKTQAKASLTAVAGSGALGLALAYTGHGVWSIVWYQLANFGLNVFLIWIFSHWRPILTFSLKAFREMFGFGSKLAIAGIIDTLYTNIYLIVIGKIFKASDLGYYTRAQQFAAFPSSNITSILQRVTFPVLCQIQDEDERLTDVYRRFLRLSGFIVFPLMVGLSVLAKPLILTILTPDWEFSALLLSIICYGMMWYPIHSINLNLLQVKGRSDLFLKLEFWKKGVGIGVLCITIPLGLVAICIGSVITSLIALSINTYYTGKLIGFGFWKQMWDLFPTLLSSLGMGLIVYAVTLFFTPYWLKLIIGFLVGIVIYIGLHHLTGSKDLKFLISLIRRKG